MCNNAVSRIFGLSGSDVERKKISELISSDDSARIIDKLSLLGGGRGKRLKVEVRFKKPDGLTGWCRFNISGINFQQDSPSCMLAIVEDITKQILLEKQMKKAKLIAEQATRTKSEFLANMSHENSDAYSHYNRHVRAA